MSDGNVAMGAAAGVTTGYSGTPLPKKLGLKDGQAALFIDLPEPLGWLQSAVPFRSVTRLADWEGIEKAGDGFDVVHAFTRSAAGLKAGLRHLQSAIAADGMIWVSWPKRASGVATDVTEDVVRGAALALDLVDVKVAAVDDTWSGLKLVIRKQARHRYGGQE